MTEKDDFYIYKIRNRQTGGYWRDESGKGFWDSKAKATRIFNTVRPAGIRYEKQDAFEIIEYTPVFSRVLDPRDYRGKKQLPENRIYRIWNVIGNKWWEHRKADSKRKAIQLTGVHPTVPPPASIKCLNISRLPILKISNHPIYLKFMSSSYSYRI